MEILWTGGAVILAEKIENCEKLIKDYEEKQSGYNLSKNKFHLKDDEKLCIHDWVLVEEYA